MIRGVLLDFYGTVVQDDDDIVSGIVADLAARAGVAAEVVGAAWAREYQAQTVAPVFRTLRECVLRSMAAVLAEVGVSDDPERLCAPQFAYWAAPPPAPGTREFLAAVDVPVCVVSDTDRSCLDAAAARHGLTFAGVVTSEEVGAYKPDRAMFDAGLATLGLPASGVVHIGDSLTCDVRGAAAAGIRAAWINRRSRPAPPGLPIAWQAPDLGALAPLMSLSAHP